MYKLYNIFFPSKYIYYIEYSFSSKKKEEKGQKSQAIESIGAGSITLMFWLGQVDEAS